jgi:hypothetical protein
LRPLWEVNVSTDVAVGGVVAAVDGVVDDDRCRNLGGGGGGCGGYGGGGCVCCWSRVVGACQVSAAKRIQMRVVHCYQEADVGVGWVG